MADCFTEVKNAIRKTADEKMISDSEIKDFVEDLEALRNQTTANRDRFGSFQELIREKLEAQRELSIKEQMIKANNIIKNQRFISQVMDPKVPGSVADKFLAELEGGSTRKGTFYGTIQEAQAQSREIMGNLELTLRRDGEFDLMSDPAFEKDVMKAIVDIENGKTPTGQEKANSAAKKFIGASNAIRQMYKDAGVPIGKIPGWIMRQGHDAEKIAKDIPGWVADQLKHLDHEKTFGAMNLKQKTEMLADAAQKIVDGKWGRFDGDAKDLADQLITVNKMRIVGKEARSARTFHYRDGEAFYEYNSKWGRDSLLESTYKTIDKDSRNVALLRKFGTNPEAALKANIERVERLLKDKPAELEKFQAKKPTIELAYKIAQGSSDHVGNDMVAKGLATFRAVQAMSKLSLTAVRAMNDVNTAMALIKSATGKNMLEIYSKIIPDYLDQVTQISGLKRTEVAQKTGTFMTDFLHEMYKFGSGDLQPTPSGHFMTTVQKSQDLFFKYTGIKLQEMTGRSTVAKALSNFLADDVGKSFDQLHPNLKSSLQRFDIGPKEWQVLQKATEEFYDGTKGVTTNAIDLVDKDTFAEILGMSGKRLSEDQMKSQLKNKLASFYQDYGDLTVLATKPSTSRVLGLKGNPYPLLREFAKLGTQFKGAALTQLEGINRMGSIDGKLNASSVINTAVPFMMAATVTQYGINQLINAGRGKGFDDPEDVGTWVDAFGRSGGFGIYYDLIQSAAHGHPEDFVLGPGGTSIKKTLADTGRELKDGNFSKAADAFITEQEKNLPFANLKRNDQNVYDVFLLNGVKEFLNPGSNIRRERRLRKQANR